MNFTTRTIAVFLLSIFLFNSMGYFIVFKVSQLEIKNDIISEIKLGTIKAETIIVIDKKNSSSIEWLDDGKEMMYNNQRYDIAKTIDNTTSTTYYCINDKQEDELFSNLSEHINTHIAADKPNKNNTSKSLENDVVKIFYTNQQDVYFKENINKATFISFREDYSSADIPASSTPPRFI